MSDDFISKKYLYCPRCGNIHRFKDKYCDFCLKDVSIFNRQEYKKALLQETDIDVIEDVWNIEEIHALDGSTESLYRYVWEKYVDIPENDNLNREAHEALKADRLEFFTHGIIPVADYALPQKKDASVIGRAAVGGVIAGPAGAVVGALSAVDKNNKNRK